MTTTRFLPAFPSYTLSIGAISLLATIGCDKNETIIVLKTTPQQRLVWALGDPDADVRRTSLNKLADSDPVEEGNPLFISSLVTIAQNDPNPHVRCAALRTLAASPARGELLKTAIELAKDADGRVRRDACETIVLLLEEGEISDDRLPDLETVFQQRLSNEDDAEVRIVACRGLSRFKSRQTLLTLISVLDERNFSIVYHAEAALVRLTGLTFGGDWERWKQWYEEAEAPFALAGTADMESGDGTFFGSMGRAIKKILKSWSGKK
jgi:hypothetical protein